MGAVRFPVVVLLLGPAFLAPHAVAAQPAPPAEARQPAGPAEEPAFDVLEFRVAGNTVLPALAIEEAVYPFLGEGRSIAEVEQARAALEKAYQGAGYLTVLVDIPEQDVKDGVVTLRVTEGSVEKLRVTGNRYYSRGAIRAAVPELAPGSVPYFPQVQQELAALARTPDRQVTPVLKPGRTPGRVEVELQVEDRLPLHGGLEVNNRQTPNTDELRASGFLRYDNLWQRGHSASLTYQTAPTDRDDTQVWSVTYVLPAPRGDALVALYYINSKSDVAAVGDVNVVGSGDIYGLRGILPLPARPGFFHSLSLGIDYKDFDESVNLLGSDRIETPISYAPLTAQYTATLAGDTAETRFGAGVALGIRDFLGNDDAEFAVKRFRARANFIAFRGELGHTRKLPRGWELAAAANLQLADQPLISNEQFAAGGVDSVRGYLEAEQFGDDGLRGSLELRTPRWSLPGEAPAGEIYALAFVEGAHLRIKDPLPGQQSRIDLSSAGVGLRIKAWKSLTAGLDVGWPFKATQYTDRYDPRAHFRLGYEF